MPRRRLPGPHQVGRHHPIKRIRADGRWFGMGPQAEDGVSGWLFPVRLMVSQRGFLVSRLYKDGSLDREPQW